VAGEDRVAVGTSARGAERADGTAATDDILDHELLREKMSATIRPVMSAGPPGANGTITVAVFVG
jgi:hypothetical protein